MKKVIAYGPEILALEDYFDGETIVLNGYKRFFVLKESTLYCNLTESKNGWVAARMYELEQSDLEKFRELFPNSYSKLEIDVEQHEVSPVVQTARTFVGEIPEFQVPLQEENMTAYTLYENLSISISEVFASKFALSTHSELLQSKKSVLTSYFKQLDEISLLECRKRVLTK